MSRRVSIRRRAARGRTPAARRGFTLVEMLVAVTLVLIMMLMFAQVFELASGMHTRVRGLSRNDQRSRVLTTMLAADIGKRTFRLMMPFARNEVGYGRERWLEQRQGYFYISENNPADNSDDVLQLTVRSLILYSDDDPTPYYGLVNASPVGLVPKNRQETLISSTAADLSYFLRDGVLYRRVLLLYQPVGGRSQPYDDSSSREIFSTSHPSPYLPSNQSAFHKGADNQWNTRDDRGNFWKDFDFSAHYTSSGTRLHTDQSLVNIQQAGSTPLGIPGSRFGHDHATGLPREYVPGPGPDGLWNTAGDNGPFYIGRFTHEETSNFRFRYPQTSSAFANGNAINDGNPMKSAGVQSTPLQIDEDGVIKQFRGGPRRSEDILMSNVHSFDIKVWDDALGGFFDIGHATAGGDYRIGNRANDSYGPGGPTGNRVFDTWHPSVNSAPPYRLTLYGHRTASGHQKGLWTASTNYFVDNVVFPENEPDGPLAFRCTQVTGEGRSGATPPRWPDTPGRLIRENEDLNRNLVLDPGEDTNSNGQLDSVTWQAVNNWLPLKAIQITIRFRDPTSELIRQMTQVYSLVD